MRPAYTLLGIMTLIFAGGAHYAFTLSDRSLRNEETSSTINMQITLTSPGFEHEGSIPLAYTCDAPQPPQVQGGDQMYARPELHIAHVPEGTKSLVLVMDDRDIPESVKQSAGIEKFDHLVMYNIPPETRILTERGVFGESGRTSLGTTQYVPPCPPDGEHRYSFRLYALPEMLEFDHVPTLDEVEERARAIMLDSTELIGRYVRAVFV